MTYDTLPHAGRSNVRYNLSFGGGYIACFSERR